MKDSLSGNAVTPGNCWVCSTKQKPIRCLKPITGGSRKVDYLHCGDKPPVIDYGTLKRASKKPSDLIRKTLSSV
jgi:hypothetical protein